MQCENLVRGKRVQVRALSPEQIKLNTSAYLTLDSCFSRPIEGLLWSEFSEQQARSNVRSSKKKEEAKLRLK